MTSPLTGLPPALYASGRVPLTSNQTLVDDVNAIAAGRGFSLQGEVVRELSGKNAALRPIAAIDLLDALGRATSSLPGLARTGAAGMIGLTALKAASQWAVLKYLWAFRRPSPNVAFSALAKQVRSHQRAVFSEQFGIAVATCVVETMAAKNPGSLRIVDADALIDDPELYGALGKLAQHRPDYFMCTTGPNPDLFVIEVKGTSTSKSVVLSQLARGLEQVATIGRVQGYNVRRIVIGALLGAYLQGFAIELPFASDDDQENAARRTLLAAGRRDLKPIPFPDRPLLGGNWAGAGDDLDTFELPRAGVERMLLGGEARRLRAMAGIIDDGTGVEPPASDLLKPTRREGVSLFLGTETRIDLGANASASVFQGVEQSILEAAVSNRQALEGRQRDFMQFRNAQSDLHGGRLVGQAADRLSYEGADGHLLEVVVTI